MANTNQIPPSVIEAIESELTDLREYYTRIGFSPGCVAKADATARLNIVKEVKKCLRNGITVTGADWRKEDMTQPIEIKFSADGLGWAGAKLGYSGVFYEGGN